MKLLSWILNLGQKGKHDFSKGKHTKVGRKQPVFDETHTEQQVAVTEQT